MNAILKLTLMMALSMVCYAQTSAPGSVFEFAIAYPGKQQMSSCHNVPGSTHEITYNQNGGDTLWVTGQNYDTLVKVALDGQMTLYSLPAGSGPHGIEFDAAGRLWVTLEFAGKIARLDGNGAIVAEYDVSLDCSTCPQPINTHPHGLDIGSDGKTIWYTGKATGTVGKVAPDGKIQTYALPTVGSVPIYIKTGPDGNMWVTELVGNKIARVTPDGKVTEFSIPTINSRPIAIVPEPGGNAMWFSEEAGNKVARIDLDGVITEFPVPKSQPNVILGGLSFDNQKNIWVQQYVDPNNANPAGVDHIVKLDKAILTANSSDISNVPVTFYPLPTCNTVLHRIIQGPDGNMWFTELHADKVGKLIAGAPAVSPTIPPAPPGNHPLLILAPDGRTTLDAASARLLVRLGNEINRNTFRAFLNGREVTKLFARASSLACVVTACDLAAVATRADGLQAGRNELRIEARHQNSARLGDSQVFFAQ